MATKQTRRSISVRGTTYDKLRVYSEGHGRSMSDVVEELLATILEQPGAAKTERTVAKTPAPVAAPVQMARAEKSASRLRFNPPPMMREKRPALANRVVRAVPPSPPPRVQSSGPSLPGRPAPKPASAVMGTPRASSKEDYRGVKF